MTLMTTAIHNDDINKVRELVLANANIVNERDEYGMPPLHLAASLGRLKIATFLIESKADAALPCANNWTPLHHAAYQGQLPILKYLDSIKVDLYATTSNRSTPLELAKKNPNTRQEIIVFLQQAMKNRPPIKTPHALFVKKKSVQPNQTEKSGLKNEASIFIPSSKNT